MRQIFTIIIVLCALQTMASGQSVLIADDGTTAPDASAILELKSDSMAFLVPRLTYLEIDAIASPAEGLMAYNTSASILCYYDGTQWLGTDGEPAYLEIGDAYQGGVVFQVDATGRGGKIAATADQGTADWGCQGTEITSGNGADSRTDGAANTAAILADCSDSPIAAEICNDYSVVDNGVTYDDWYLPAIEELLEMYAQRVAIGGFNTNPGDRYYSSTETSATQAKRVDFGDGDEEDNNKDGTARYVRPIRIF